MTKLRTPLTFAQAVTRIAGLIGFDGAARVVDRKERIVRLWSEPDSGRSPTLDQARNLDAAYRAAGGEDAPLLDAYAFQLEVQVAVQDVCRRDLLQTIEEASRDAGEAISCSVAILDPAATPAQFHRALAEVEEAHGALSRLKRRITSFLPFGAGPTATKMGGSQ
ncbi:MAG: hypothetical protein JWN59_1763 [Sphingomonas bacterium]|nr:hypothetical protein [Sphingomonas bacterium]MDB5683562.1 hypothetical protein [Sphingomonas bacterium]